MNFSQEQKGLLAAPLSRDHVKTREQGGKKLSYLESWVAIKEANRIFGHDGWVRETIEMQETNRDLVELSGINGPYNQWRVGYLSKVRITAGGVIREGTGFGSGMSKPEALGDAIESAAKEAESDAMKRALMTFGNPFGLALYDKAQAEVESPPRPVPKTAEKAGNYEAQAVPDQKANPPAPGTKAWGQKVLEMARKLEVSKLDGLLEKNAGDLVRLRNVDPILHGDIIALVQQRQHLAGGANG